MSSSIKKKDCLDNNNSNGTKGAAHSQAPAKQYSTKLSSNKSNNSFKQSREHFKQIIPQNNRSPRNISQESPKSNSVFTKEMTGNKWDKENTPLTYRSLVHVKNCHRQANVRRSKSPVLTKADQVELNHSPCGYHKKRLQESEKENQNSRTQSKRCSCVSQNIKNHPNVELSGPRNCCPLEDRLPYSHQEKRPKTDFNELKGVNSVSVLSEVHHQKTCSNCSTVSVSNDEHVDNICADSSSWKNNEELSNNAKIIGDPEVPPVSPGLNTFDDSTFQILPKQPDLSDNGNFHSQPGSVDCALDNSDANKSRDVNTRELEEQQRIIQRDKDDLTNQKLLQEQVKKQEDMIRVLQEQVRLF